MRGISSIKRLLRCSSLNYFSIYIYLLLYNSDEIMSEKVYIRWKTVGSFFVGHISCDTNTISSKKMYNNINR